ncbi:MAG: hypothetical protein WCC10_15780 [Tumebacillaceae bacterium]
MEAAAVKTVLALVNNLMFSVSIREAATSLGGLVTLVTSNEELVQKLEIHPSLVILDLTAVEPGWEQAVAKAKEAGVPVLAYGPHVNNEAREKAEGAGAEWFANSKFKIDLPNLLAKYL